MKNVHLDEEGYNKLLSDIESLKIRVIELNSTRGKLQSKVSDESFANTAHQEVDREESIIMSELENKIGISNRVNIVPKHNNPAIVDISDKLKVQLEYETGDKEIDIITLSGSLLDYCSDYNEVTLNSPIGEAIYMQEIGSTVSYLANNKTIKVTIISKVKEEQRIK